MNTHYLRLVIWIFTLLIISSLIGSLTNSGIESWYQTLNQSPLTPPNFIFGIVWSILYAMIATSGWLIWEAKPSSNLKVVKRLYLAQLVLNWLWSPVFFLIGRGRTNTSLIDGISVRESASPAPDGTFQIVM